MARLFGKKHKNKGVEGDALVKPTETESKNNAYEYNLHLVEKSDIEKVKSDFNIQTFEDIKDNYAIIKAYSDEMKVPKEIFLMRLSENLDKDTKKRLYIILNSKDSENMILYNGLQNKFFEMGKDLTEIEREKVSVFDKFTEDYLAYFSGMIEENTYQKLKNLQRHHQNS